MAFTRRLQELAKDDAVAVLTSIQSDLLSNPERGRLVPGLLIAKHNPRALLIS